MNEQFELRFGKERHTKLLDAIMRRYRYSQEKMQERYADWRKLEELDLAYLPATAGNAERKKLREDGKPQYTTIEIPYSYAIKQAAHMYLTTVFLSRSPVHQFMGTNGSAQDNELAVEALINYQTITGRALPAYYIFFNDILKYGVGFLGHYWDKKVSYVSEIVERPAMYLGLIPIPGKTQKVRQTRKITGYTGNRVYNVSPYEAFPDPRVPVAQFQKGEFFGRRTSANWTEIVERKSQGMYFNVDVLSLNRTSNFFDDPNSERSSQIVMPDVNNEGVITFDDRITTVKLLEFHWRLIPRDWGLGGSEYPERWVFTVANGSVIIGAQPLGLNYDEFPFDTADADFDGYSLFKRSMLEVAKPLNEVMTWLINAHFHNVRKVLNDQLVVDPSRVVMKDLTDPNSGRLIRLKPAAYGSDPRLAIHQLQTVDITRAHLADTEIVGELAQRATGVMDNIMGIISQSGRRSATETRTANQFSVNRLKTIAEYISASGFSSHASKLLQSSQQLYDAELTLRIAGNLMRSPEQMIMVTPDTIAGAYDYMPVDGTMPIDRNAQVMVWTQIMQQLAAFQPVLGERYDFGRIFDHVMKLTGIQNLSSFQVKIRPDMQLQNAAQAGNVIPLRGGTNGPGSTNDGAAGPTAGAGYAPGMGPVTPGS